MNFSAKTYRLARKPQGHFAVPPILPKVRRGISDCVHCHKHLLHGARGLYVLARNTNFEKRPLNGSFKTFLDIRKPHIRQKKYEPYENIKPPERNEPGDDKFEELRSAFNEFHTRDRPEEK